MDTSNSSESLVDWVSSNLTAVERALAVPLRSNKYIDHLHPWPMQAAFLVAESQPGVDETLYGGGAGPGKSWGIAYWLLQFADIPGYKGGAFRHTIGELYGTDGLIPLMEEMLAPAVDAGWASFNQNRREWTFDSDAKIILGGLYTHKEIKRLDGWSFQRVVLDELTGWANPDAWLRAVSRLRRLKGFPVAPSAVAGSNPDGPGRQWVAERWGLLENTTAEKGCYYVHTDRRDSKGLDVEDYDRKLDKLGEVLRAQKKDGNWSIVAGGDLWRDDHFPFYGEPPEAKVRELLAKPGARLLSTWDCKNKLTTSKKVRAGESFVSGSLWLYDGASNLYLLDEERGAWGFNDTVHAFYRLLGRWSGFPIEHVIEDKALGPELIKWVRRGGTLREELADGSVRETTYPPVAGVVPHSPKGDKPTRAAGIQTYVHAGNIHTPTPHHCPWVRDWRSEIARTPKPPNDRGDGLVMAVEKTLKAPPPTPFKRSRAKRVMRQVKGY